MPRARSPWGPKIDALVTRALRVGGRALGRPDEQLLQELTGRAPADGAGVDCVASQGRAAFEDALKKARRALETGQTGEALFLFSQAAEHSPQDPWPWHGRGDALQVSGDHEGAEQAYRAALERDPDLALSHNGLGNALQGQARHEQARECWRAALKLDPGQRYAQESLKRQLP